MNKSQLTVTWVILLCLPVTSALAEDKKDNKNKEFIVIQRLNSASRTHLTSGGEFSKPSANFGKASLNISKPAKRYPAFSKYVKRYHRRAAASNTGEFSKPSFSLQTNKGEFNKPSFRLRSNTGEFSKPSFSLKSNKGEFSRNSFTIASQSAKKR